jgi:beta-mannosidase
MSQTPIKERTLMDRKLLFIAGFLLLMFSACEEQQPLVGKRYLNQNWEFSQAGTDTWHMAEVPGCVHTDLMANGIIEDPFYRGNEDSVQWVSEKEWVYRTSFRIDEVEKSHQATELIFEGLDTHATVQLNGEVILNADNMFRTWSIDVSDLLIKGENHLEILFHSPEEYNTRQAAKLPYVLPEDERVHSRKAPYQFGWDWGPRLITSGIWKPVYLRFWNHARIDNAFIKTNKISDDKAVLSADLEVDAIQPANATLKISSPEGAFESVSRELSLQSGINQVSLDFEIPEPQLWWSNGLGEPNLYDVHVELVAEDGYDVLKERIGVRTIELVQEDDQYGRSFEFHLNGVPVFAKGANFIPLESFPSRLTREDYESAISDAVKANFNMLRVWGGGIYEDDAFYELCDENGIMVWQDFMFACAMYPGDDRFLETVRHEVEDNVVRLRNHASLALWCGNNEIQNGWLDWGWQKRLGYSEDDSTQIWSDYQKIFHELIPEVLGQQDPTRDYWPSSPSYGWGHEEALTQGDNHYWGVWWGMEPFSMYRKKVSRFMSEFGFQAFPPWETIKSFTLEEDRSLFSDVMQVHQKHHIGNKTIQTYMDRWYPQPKDFESFVYVSQVMQAEGMADGIAAHRRSMPYSMGTLYWQFNDCWPVVSWSSRDYYGNWKALHYRVRKIYSNLYVSPFLEDDRLKVSLVSDERTSVKGTLVLSLYDFQGELLRQLSEEVEALPNQGVEVTDLALQDFLQGASSKSTVLKAEFLKGDEVLCDNHLFFELPKDRQMEEAEISFIVAQNEKGFEVTLATDVVAESVYLNIPENSGRWSDNFFNMIPGETKTVTFETGEEIPDFEEELEIRSLADAF